MRHGRRGEIRNGLAAIEGHEWKDYQESSSQTSSNHVQNLTPRFESSSTRPPSGRTPYIVSSGSRARPSSTRDRRGSDAIHRRPDTIPEEGSRPIRIQESPARYSRSVASTGGPGTRYNDSGGYARESRSHYDDQGTSQEDPRWQPDSASPDSLAEGVRRLSINEVMVNAADREPNYIPSSVSGSGTNWPSTSSPQPVSAYYDDSARQDATPPARTDSIYGDRSGRGGPAGQESKSQDGGALEDPRRHVKSTDSKAERLDKSYKVRNHDYKSFFVPGRVFSTLWTDPYASRTNNGDNTFESSISIVKYNERVHTKIRRFVVVRQGDRSCTCLPVTTYDRKGHTKAGINLDEHGHIYSHGTPPKIHGINKQPLKVVLLNEKAKLDLSYINYGRVYTVNTNVKVKELGELDPKSRKLLRKYYNEVMTVQDEPSDDPMSTPRPLPVLTGIGAAYTDSQSTTRGSMSSTYAGYTAPVADTARYNYLTSPASNIATQGLNDSYYQTPPTYAPPQSSVSQASTNRSSYFPASGSANPPIQSSHTLTSSYQSNPPITNQYTLTNQYSSNFAYSSAPRFSTDVARTTRDPSATSVSDSYQGGGRSQINSASASSHLPPVDTEEIDLPSTAEVQASRSGRDSVSRTHREHRDRERDRRRR
ncbi:hypothetical protein B7494_g3787 [Chlorociboria aeruginascens]|nr:hypothetical protein B7494_g3787 [Chlorociboria aeruginascens]